jgi:hypothetical protein
MKTLREHHLETRLQALQDDLSNYAQRIVSIELLAITKGWDYVCDSETVFILSRNIYTA